jgi:hypothetical protein
MAVKFNNRTLIIILILLAGVFLVSRYFRSKTSEGNLKDLQVKIDTAKIDRISIYPKAENKEEIRFTRTGDLWTVQKGEIVAEAEAYAVSNIFSEILTIKADQLVATAREKWSEFHVNDSLGTRVVMNEGKKTRLDMLIGRFNYQPAPGGYGAGYGQNYGRGITYVRVSDENEVYAIEGFLAMTFNQDFNSWRNQVLLSLTKDNITRITLDYPMDSGFVIVAQDSLWLMDGVTPDSAKMAQYLNALSRKSGSEFVDDFNVVTAPDYQLTIEGNNMQAVTVKAYLRPGEEYILNSSLNPKSFFSSGPDGIFRDLFKSRSELLK